MQKNELIILLMHYSFYIISYISLLNNVYTHVYYCMCVILLMTLQSSG